MKNFLKGLTLACVAFVPAFIIAGMVQINTNDVPQWLWITGVIVLTSLLAYLMGKRLENGSR